MEQNENRIPDFAPEQIVLPDFAPDEEERRLPEQEPEEAVQEEVPEEPAQAEAAAQEEPQPEEDKKAPQGWDTYEMLHDLVYMLAVITLIFVFFFRLVGVSGSSMYPTLYDRDYLVLESNFLYRKPEYGDVVVLNEPEWNFDGPIVKRIIATEGQTVDIDFDSGIVYVDGQALDEPYIFEPTYNSNAQYGLALEYPVTVPDNCVFFMGDNRNHSSDSRISYVGCADKSKILGKVLLRIIPAQQTNEYGEIIGGRDLGRIGTVK